MMRLILLSMKYLKMNIKSIKKNKTMKIINLLIIQWIAVTSAKLTFLWVIIEFILYLVIYLAAFTKHVNNLNFYIIYCNNKI